MSNTPNGIKIGIVGIGMVGTPLMHYFESERDFRRGEELFLFDRDPIKNYNDDVSRADVVFICVPTPRRENGSVNIEIAERAIANITGEKIVVIKSTVPPGTTERFQQKYPRHKFLFNPEFLTEKNAWNDFINPDRQIVGFAGKNRREAERVLSLLPKAPFMSPAVKAESGPLAITATEAEIIKYGGNVFLARKVNFANMLALLSDAMQKELALLGGGTVDYRNIAKGVGADMRIGASHLGVDHGGYRGFGGYCLPKDLDGLIAHVRVSGLHMCEALLQADRNFNEKLLASQGLTLEEISNHDAIVEEKLQRLQKSSPTIL